MQTDCELLGQYVKDGSEAAFAELVRRYIRLVYSVALRQVGREAHLAEDITQTVFIILARKARRLAGHETLAGWLHTTTRQAALSALRNHRRRQTREQKALAMETNSPAPVPWEQMRPLLDEAVGQLNKPDRQAVLLRFFQGWSHREVGEALGQTEDAARVRINRALEKLRQYFAGRGIVTTGALLGEVILANAAEAEPAGLAGRVNRNAASASATASAGWGGLILWMIFMTTKNKILIVAMLILLASLFTLVVPNWIQPSESENPVAPLTTKAKSMASKNGQPGVQLPETAPKLGTPSNSVTTVATAGPFGPTPPAPPPPPAFGGPGGAIKGSGPNPFPNPYNNLFIKLQFTSAQIDAFSKIISNNQKQESEAYQAAEKKLSQSQIDKLMTEALAQIEDDPNIHNPGSLTSLVMNKMDDLLGIAAQLQTIKDHTDSQLRQLFGSEANYQYYQDYTKQAGVRFWVINRYGSTLQSAGLPDLSVDQQEALVGIVVQNLHAEGDPISSQNRVQQVLDQASAILSPEQVEVLATKSLQGPASLSYVRFNYTP